MVKNKVAPPFQMAEFDMMHNNGISYEGDILDMAIEENLITRSGAWFRHGEQQLGQGRERVRDFLKENPDVCEDLKQQVMVARGFAVAEEKKEVAKEKAEVAEEKK